MTEKDPTPAQEHDRSDVPAPDPLPSVPVFPAENPVQVPLDFTPADGVDAGAVSADAIVDETPSGVVEPEGPPQAERQPETPAELPEDLLAVQAALEQPTGEMTAVLDGDAPEVVGTAAILDQIAPGTIATSDEEAAESGENAAEGDQSAAQREEGSAEGEAVDTAEGEADVAEEEQSQTEVAEELVVPPKRTVPWWPFILYDLAWLGAAGYVVWKLQETPAGLAPYETDLYRLSMVGGLALLAAGPALILIVWLASFIGRKNRKIGAMFISALVKGAGATLLGALIWLGAIMLTDYLHLGRPF